MLSKFKVPVVVLNGLSYIYARILDILSPPCCAYCKKFLPLREIFCESCYARLQPVFSIMLPVTSTKSVKVFAAAAYREPIKTLIIAKSWGDSVASHFLGNLIWQRTDLKHAQFDYLIPIPLHWTRQAKRGYNQAEEIANTLAKLSGKKVIPLLKRVKRTPFQSTLSSDKRLKNVTDAFALTKIDKELYKNKHLVVVDDLMTTGATLRSAAHLLFQLKPASIMVVVAARVVN